MSKVLILRTCHADLTSRRGFQWPESGPVEAPDWNPSPVCGGGLHGWLWGEGDGSPADWCEDAKWLVVEVDESSIVDLGGKVKFPRGTVVFCGGRAGATAYLAENGGQGRAVIGSTVSGGVGSTVSGGNGSTVSGGDWSMVSGGDGSTVYGGDGSTVYGGDSSRVSGGNGSTVSGRDRSIVSGGRDSMVFGGFGSMVSGGDRSTVFGGDGSTVSGGDGSAVAGGDGSTVSGGVGSTVSGGDKAAISARWWDGSADRYRIAVGYIGEGGLEPGVRYRLDECGQWQEAETATGEGD